MAQAPSNSSAPDSPPGWRYRLNPYHFLSDRKIWILVGILMPLMAYGLMAHFIAVSAGYSAGSQVGYWVSIAVLLAALPANHASILLDRRRRSEVAVGELEAGKGTQWMLVQNGRRIPISGGSRDAAEFATQIVRSKRLPGAAVAEITALICVLRATYDSVFAYASRISRRDPSRDANPAIRLAVSPHVGSPFCYALAFGRMTIVFPLGAVPHDSSAPPVQSGLPEGLSPERTARVRYLLAHELSHLLLRDEPLSIFADARLISISSSAQSVAALVLLPITFALVLSRFSYARGPLAVSLIAIFLMAAIIGGWRLLKTAIWPEALRVTGGFGAATVVRGLFLLLPCLVVGELVTFAGLIGGHVDAMPRADCFVSFIVVLCAVTISKLCVYLGRRQLEFVADENAVNSLAEQDRATTRSVRDEVALILDETFQTIIRTAGQSPVPDYAIGHAETMHLSILGRLVQGLTTGSGVNAPTGAQPLRSSSRRGWLVRMSEMRIFGRVLRLWKNGVAPLTRTHPTLLDRMKVVLDPDLQVEQDPTVPLVYAALPLVLFPFLVQHLAGNEVVSNRLSGALLAPLYVVFLALFTLIARRPTRTSRNEGDAAVEVGLSAAVAHEAASGQAPDMELTAVGGWYGFSRALRTWWRAPNEQAAAQLAMADFSPSKELKSSSIAGEIWIVVRSLAIAGVLGISVGKLVLWLLGLERGDIILPLLFVNLPPLSTIGAVIVVVSLFASWYVLSKFLSLSQWHYYSGTGFWLNVALQFFNVVKAFLFAVVLVTLALVMVAVLAPTAAMMPFGSTAVEGTHQLHVLASGRLYGDVGLVIVLFVGIAGAAYAAVVCWWPTLPKSVRCPLGHVTPTHWHDPLHRPADSESKDWAWLRCVECGRSTHVRHLLCDSDPKGPPLRASAAGSFVIVGILALFQLAFPILVVGSRPPLLEANGRCRALWQNRAAETKKAAFLDCIDQPEDLAKHHERATPQAPKSWERLSKAVNQADLVALGASADVASALSALGDAGDDRALAPVRVSLPWKCGDWLTIVRNDVAYLEACAQTKPAESQECASFISSEPISSDANIARACGCLWASEAPVASGEKVGASARVAALQWLFNRTSLILHRGAAPACEGAGREDYANWHVYIEDELAPRLFMAAAGGEDPNRYLVKEGPPRPTPTCRRIFSDVADRRETKPITLKEKDKDASGSSKDVPVLAFSLTDDGVLEALQGFQEVKDDVLGATCQSIYEKWIQQGCQSLGDTNHCKALGSWKNLCFGNDAQACLSDPRQLLGYANETETAVAIQKVLQRSAMAADRGRLLPIAATMASTDVWTDISTRSMAVSALARVAFGKADKDVQHLLERLDGFDKRMNDERETASKSLAATLESPDDSAKTIVTEVVKQTEIDEIVFPFCMTVGQHSRELGRRLLFHDFWVEQSGSVRVLLNRTRKVMRESKSSFLPRKLFLEVALAKPVETLELCNWAAQWRRAVERDAHGVMARRPLTTAAAKATAQPQSKDEGQAADTAEPAAAVGDESVGELTRPDAAWQTLGDLERIASWHQARASFLPEFTLRSFPALRQSWAMPEER